MGREPRDLYGAGSIRSCSPRPPSTPNFVQTWRHSGFGTKGIPVELECNHFEVKYNPSEEDVVLQYHVTIEPAAEKGESRKVIAKFCETFGRTFLERKCLGKFIAYDGENSLFAVCPTLTINAGPSELFSLFLEDEPERGGRRIGDNEGPVGKKSLGDDEDGRPSQRRRIGGGQCFDVRIKFAAEVNMGAIQSILAGNRDDSAQDALRVLDILLREQAAKRGFLRIRDSYFHSSLGPVGEIGEGVQTWRGYHASFKPASRGCLTLNFDVSTATVMKPSPVLIFLEDLCGKDVNEFAEIDWLKARRTLKGVKVETYAGRKHRILGFSSEPCHLLSFERKIRVDNPYDKCTRTEQITVADYFQNDLKMRLQHPQLPALDMGRPGKPLYLPIELCRISEGQRYKRNLSHVQRKYQTRHARQEPPETKLLCKLAMDTNHYQDCNLFKELNIQIEPTVAVVKGLDSLIGSNTEVKPMNGRWEIEGKNLKVACKAQKWAVANFSHNPIEDLEITSQLRVICASMGMQLDEATIFHEHPEMVNRGSLERVNDMILRQMVTVRVDFVLAILPEKRSDLYVPLKKVCETKVGIVTQCIVLPDVFRHRYLTSVALKINHKCGGHNTVLLHEEDKLLPKVSAVPTCIFGLGLSNPGAGDSSPGIAAAVASMHWPKFSTYATRVRVQASKKQIIEGLYEEEEWSHGGMVMELLHDFFRTCQGPSIESRKPQQIVIYRNGVSNSQFDQVLEKELTAIKKAARGLEKDPQSTYNPKITLIVLQKRHHTRFFPTDGNINVMPGTIVDRDICHPRQNDFFLCSHAALSGTTRPTHYHVLFDEIGFTANELQNLTHCLCYSSARGSTALSVAAPAHLAHLAARHCRSFVTNDGSESDSGSDSSVSAAKAAALPAVNPKLLTKMFYT